MRIIDCHLALYSRKITPKNDLSSLTSVIHDFVSKLI